MAFRARDVAVISVGTTVLCYATALAVVRLASNRVWLAPCKDCWRGLRSLTCRQARAPDRFELEVARQVDKNRLARAHSLLGWMVLGFCLPVFAIVQNRLREIPSRLSEVQDGAIMFGAAFSLLLWHFPQIVTLRSLDVLYSILMLITMAFSLYTSDGWIASNGSLPASNAFCLIFSLFNLKWKLNVFWILVISFVGCVNMFQGGTLQDPRQVVETEAVRTFIFLLVLKCVDEFRTTAVRLDLEAKGSKEELLAAKSVLWNVCDVVVELDLSLKLQVHSQGLTDMLLLNPQRSLAGENLQDFLATDPDREKFAEQVRALALPDSDQSGTRHSIAFNVGMKDGSGVPINVEVFSVCFRNRHGEVTYFVGIRECTDVEIAAMTGQGADEASVGRRGRRRRKNRASERQSSGDLPPTVVGLPLSETSSCSGSSDRTIESSASSFRRRELLRPSYEPTLESAMVKQLALVILQFNYFIPRHSCCWLHAGVSQLKLLLKSELRSLPCEGRHRVPPCGGQCQECGLIIVEQEPPQETCELCGGDVMISDTSSGALV